MLVLEGSAHVCVLVNPESAVCACTSDLPPLPAQEEEGTWLAVFMRVLYVGAVEGSALSVAIHGSVLCVCVWPCVPGIHNQLHYRLNLQREK